MNINGFVAGTVGCVFPRAKAPDSIDQVIAFSRVAHQSTCYKLTVINSYSANGEYRPASINGVNEGDYRPNSQQFNLVNSKCHYWNAFKVYGIQTIVDVNATSFEELLDAVQDKVKGSIIISFFTKGAFGSEKELAEFTILSY